MLSNLCTMLEILVAELIFLYPYPRRERFPLRYGAALFACFAAAFLIPERLCAGAAGKLYTFARYMSLFAVSTAAMCRCFDAKGSSILSACAAGYAVQHAASRIEVVLSIVTPLMDWIGVPGQAGVLLAELLIFPFVYLAAWLVFGRLAEKCQFYKSDDRALSVLSISMIAVCIGLSRLDFSISAALYSIAFCVFALLVQIALHRVFALREENRMILQMMREQERHYELRKENIELINRKCHDLKHRLLAYNGMLPREEIESMTRAVNIYDGSYHTGNEPLDVILADKSNWCAEQGISFTCMGDMRSLSFMSVMDIYVLFGNALDNAIEAAGRLADREKRVVSLTVEKRGALVLITVSNYFEGALRLVDGVPATTKEEEPGYHGYGFKSMKRIAEKYDGDIQAVEESGVFNLCVYLMAA